ncbi:CRISPR-associated protein Cas2 [Desulfofarcimen acetoxidans DSM 771]|uniref:CRISPR-associated endoribonuclease Cas2 n=1 Tax=Desulfofarcimen acetoxidans (strain ATCC 49208 / DSM 771 / KCTC 5769 / VKM B-1644 / 5575) TaxID=485916 RepID=C8VZK7_DESAS|nr:CRISPR-associated endonuclease Cas2 [Desulfofarcimen acetoxidans]ACV64952.1 CRISPR-associated protein Cas2 [Desulfofarcimen acetoxidans DSM 771]
MFVILVYDVGVKRVNKVLKKCRAYLHWVQNSVLEGDITESNYIKLKAELSKIINTKEDSVVIYTFRLPRYNSRETLGIKKGGEENIF